MSSKKLLPKPSDNIHLSDVGYAVHKSESARHRSLKRASKKNGALPVVRRLNLIRNLTRSGSKNKKILSKDVEYVKKIYKQEKKKHSKK